MADSVFRDADYYRNHVDHAANHSKRGGAAQQMKKWITSRWLSFAVVVVAVLVEIVFQGSPAKASREEIEFPVKTLTPNDYLHKAIDAQLEKENAKRKFAVATREKADD